MRIFLILSFFLIVTVNLVDAESIPTHIFKNGEEAQARFTDSLEVLFDYEGQLSISEILDDPDAKFSVWNGERELVSPMVIWSRIRLTNSRSSTLDGYFRFFSFIDSIWVYTVEDGNVIDQTFTGNVLRPWDKDLLTNHSNIPLSLLSGETRTYYFKRSYSIINCPMTCLSSLRYVPRDVLINEKIRSQTRQSFYAGVMLLFGLFSGFMFFMFRERVFVYYSLLMFSYIAYFATENLLTEIWFNRHFTSLIKTDSFLAISAIALSFSFFINAYLNLQKRFPRLRLTYLGISLFTAFFTFIGRVFTSDLIWLANINNMLLVFWIIATMTVIVVSIRKSDKSTITLLISVGVLFIGALVYVLALVLRIPSEDSWMYYAFQIGTVLFSGTLFYGLFDKIDTIKAEKLRFEELDEMKSRFFANISHEFRTPLTLVMGPIQQVLENVEAPKDKNRLQLAYQNAERLLELINQLLDLSKLESKQMKLVVVKQNLSSMLKGIVMSFESLASRKNIRLNFVTQKEELFLYIDKDKIEQIFYNLLSNAFKFTKENGEIAVMVVNHDDHVEVLVRDNGIGIPATRLRDIFNRFFQVDSSEVREQEGSGIGLALVKELTDLHKGQIKVESKINEGTTFTLLFQKGKAHFKENEIYLGVDANNTEPSAPSAKRIPMVPETEILETENISRDELDKERPIILIIEDNTAVRNYITEYLNSSFQILEASNGQDGIDKAFEYVPDLVISDVMMPYKNGYEVCAILKKDQRTSHIPIILLTAKAASDEKLKGLEIGADDYLVKPFNSKELEIRMINLIETRIKLRKRFSESTTLEKKVEDINPLDKEFIEKVYSIIETHISNEQFGVEFLANEIELSRSQLNRKLKALTDYSANKFIQSYRLQRAKELLEKKEGNVSEIAMETGFKSTAYFVKCFGDKYGKTPGSFL